MKKSAVEIFSTILLFIYIPYALLQGGGIFEDLDMVRISQIVAVSLPFVIGYDHFIRKNDSNKVLQWVTFLAGIAVALWSLFGNWNR